MSKRKRANQNFAIPDYVEFDGEFSPLTCEICGSDDLFTETITAEEWAGGRSIDTSFIRYTCMNENCGHYWDVKP